MLTHWLLNSYFQSPGDWTIPLGGSPQAGSPFAVVYARTLWRNEPLRNKLRALLSHRWAPSEEQLQASAAAIFRTNIFGGTEDYGDHLLHLAAWHFSREFSLDALTDNDKEKAGNIDVFTGVTRSHYIDANYTPLPLWLAKKDPNIASLIFPMVLKIPVISIRYYLDIHYAYVFNAIRKADHPQADAMISLLYDLAFIQQKIAVGFHEYIRLLVHTRAAKNNSVNPVGSALQQLELIVTHLKASIEKINAFVELVFGLVVSTAGSRQATGLAGLQLDLPPEVYRSFQWRLIDTVIDPANLEELNAYGSGLLYKKGVQAFAPLHEQHTRNTAALLCVLSLLTDQLTALDPYSKKEQGEFLGLYNSLE